MFFDGMGPKILSLGIPAAFGQILAFDAILQPAPVYIGPYFSRHGNRELRLQDVPWTDHRWVVPSR